MDSELKEIFILGFAIATVFGLFGFFLIKKRTNYLKNLLESVSAKLGGQVIVSQFDLNPLFKINVNGKDVIVNFQMRRKFVTEKTFIKTKLFNNSSTITVTPKNILSLFNINLRNHKIKHDIKHFESLHTIRNNDPHITNTFLSAELKTQLLDMAQWSPSINIKNDMFQLTFMGLPQNELDFEKMLNLTQKILEKF